MIQSHTAAPAAHETGFGPEQSRRLLNDFSGELEERLLSMTRHMLELERRREPVPADPLLASIIREVHNIKGTARAIGLESVAGPAEALEDLFKRIRGGTAVYGPVVLGLSYRVMDAMSRTVDAAVSGGETAAAPTGAGGGVADHEVLCAAVRAFGRPREHDA
jgi:two-component system chemotaxis sensor kinase CheA